MYIPNEDTQGGVADTKCLIEFVITSHSRTSRNNRLQLPVEYLISLLD